MVTRNGRSKTVTPEEIIENEMVTTEKEHLGDVEKETGIYASEVEVLEKVMTVDIASKTLNKFNELRSIDVGEYIEKKNGLSYLSWAYAVDMLFQHDPDANWEFLEPTVYPDGSVMMWCVLTAFGKTTKMQLPVLDYKNKPISNPNCFQMNTAMMRCLAKAIAVGTGLGLYIYRGEDLPVEETKSTDDNEELFAKFYEIYGKCQTLEELKTAWENTPKNIQPKVKHIKDAQKADLDKKQ